MRRGVVFPEEVRKCEGRVKETELRGCLYQEVVEWEVKPRVSF